MKKMNRSIIVALVLVGGLVVGIVKGQDARHRWVSKMKNKQYNRKFKFEKNDREVALDDYELASFHKS